MNTVTSPSTPALLGERLAALDVRRVLQRLTGASIALLLLVGPWMTALVAPGMIGVAVLGALLMLERRRIPCSALAVAAFFVPLTQTLSLVNTSDLTASAHLAILAWAGFGCLLAVAQLDEKSMIVVMEALLLSAALVCVGAMTQMGQMTSEEGGSVINGRLQGPFSQPNELGSFAQLTLPLVPAFALSSRPRIDRGLALLAAPVVAAALMLSLSRGAWLGAIVSAVVLAWLAPRLRRPLAALVGLGLAAMALTLAVGGPGSAIISARLHSIVDSSASTSDQRPAIWEFALRLLGDHPFLGAGAGSLPTASLDAHTSAVALVQPQHAHNVFLAALSEGGLLGCLTLVALLAVGVWCALQLRRAIRSATPWRESWIPLAATASLAGAAAHGAIDFPWRAPALTLTTWVMAGVLARTFFNERPLMAQTESPSTPAAGGASTSGASKPGVDADDAAPARPRPKAATWAPLALAVIGTLLVALATSLLPQKYTATTIVGLRPSAASGSVKNPVTTDNMRQIAQQYAIVAASADSVDAARAQAKVADDATVAASVDPESTTLRIAGTAPSAADAAALADAVAQNTTKKVDADLARADVLDHASADAAVKTPRRSLYFVAGELVLLTACAAAWLLMRRRR